MAGSTLLRAVYAIYLMGIDVNDPAWEAINSAARRNNVKKFIEYWIR